MNKIIDNLPIITLCAISAIAIIAVVIIVQGSYVDIKTHENKHLDLIEKQRCVYLKQNSVYVKFYHTEQQGKILPKSITIYNALDDLIKECKQ